MQETRPQKTQYPVRRSVRNLKYTPRHQAKISKVNSLKRTIVAILTMAMLLQFSFPVIGSTSGATEVTAVTGGAATTTDTAGIPGAPSFVSITYQAGWNMVVASAKTDIDSKLYTYDATTKIYTQVDTPTVGDGYWAFFMEPTQALITLPLINELAVDIQAGWNMVGNPFDADIAVPAGYRAFIYDPSTSAYKATAVMPKGHSVWIQAPAAATIKLSKQAPAPVTEPIVPTEPVVPDTSTAGSPAPTYGKPDLSGPMINAKDKGAKGDGVADDTNAIKSALSAASSGSIKTVYLPKGTYKIASTLRPATGVRLIGDGKNESIIKMGASKTDAIVIENANDVTIANLQVRDVVNPGDAESWAIHAKSSQRVTIDHVKVINSDDAGIRVGYSLGSGLPAAKHAKVTNCEVIDTKEGSGIEVIRGEDALVANNVVSGSAQHGIRLCGAQRPEVRHNLVTKNGDGIDMQGFTSPLYKITGFNVHHNLIIDNRGNGMVSWYGPTDGKVMYNRVEYTSGSSVGYSLRIADGMDPGARNVQVTNNTFIRTSKPTSVSGSHQNLVIENNRVSSTALPADSTVGPQATSTN